MIIYVMELQDGYYYIDKTENMANVSTETEWIRLHPFKDYCETIVSDVTTDEHSLVLNYMNMYGVDKVRGGLYKSVVLTHDECLTIRKQLNYLNNKCVACGLFDHSLQNCLTKICYRCGRTGHEYNYCAYDNHVDNGLLNGCMRCGRSDHISLRCNRSKDVYGRILEKKCIIS